jgi:NAD(P)H-flavin reductase
MPGISLLGSHPFTIASLCSEDFPSNYGEEYRDMTLVFRPFGGFTKEVLETALNKGPFKTYRSFIDGPYGGMRRDMASFDNVIFFAGGSGITAIASQLLDLIKRMRDGKALTRSVRVIWALKRPETLEWFREELRICREYAPPGSVHCQFYLTAAKRYDPTQPRASRPHSGLFNDKINDMFQGVASKRNSAHVREAAEGDPEIEKELRRENEDGVAPLPTAHIVPHQGSSAWNQRPISGTFDEENRELNFGFPTTPTMLQKNLMRFAFLPAQKKDGWRTEYGRPDIPFMLRQFSREFGKRTCVFVCGPPSMRVDVANSVAKLQRMIMADPEKEELFLHAENYAI